MWDDEVSINSTITLLAAAMQDGVLPLINLTLYQMKWKQPHGEDADPKVLLPDIPEEIHHIKFHSREAESIKKAILKTKGAAGLPDIDVDERAKRILTSSQLVWAQTIYLKHSPRLS